MPTVPQSKSRGWCFTINNPTDEDTRAIDNLQQSARYYVYGKETGENNTPHYQGYVYFDNRQRFGTVKQFLGRAHLEPQRGSCEQAIAYCKKDGQWTEWGHEPDSHGIVAQREKWKTIVDLAERGELEQLKLLFPGEYVRYGGRLRSLRLRPTTVIQGNLENEWWVGLSGTGKSKTLWQTYPEHYGKDLNKWWDGYQDEEIVAIEEWSPKYEMLASKLKVWADRYPFNAEIKGGTLLKIRPKKVIVLSNYTIEQCFPNPEDQGPLKRRFKSVYFPFQSPPNSDVNFIEAIEELEQTLSLPTYAPSDSDTDNE